MCSASASRRKNVCGLEMSKHSRLGYFARSV
jgi:hypothetical protein